MVGLVWGFVAMLAVAAWFAYDLPDIETATALERRPSVTLLDASGRFLSSYGDIYGMPVRIAELPPYLPQAVVAIEDRRFYDHIGLDLLGLGRAAAVNLASGGIRQGGSTITQQLAKNLFLTPERSASRKIKEALLALWLERRFSKDEILELYLNRVYFGAGAYGVDAAARRYFGKPASEVTLWEAATLAGLLRAPSRLAPTRSPTAAAERAGLVLAAMAEVGFIAPEAAREARRSEIAVTPAGPGDARYFIDWVLEQVEGYVGFVDRDLLVRTTMDSRLQRLAMSEVNGAFAEAGSGGPTQAALVAMTPDGAVRAMVGGRSYGGSQFNRATQALRQPGSAFKLFVYLAALEQGMTPSERFEDAPIRIGTWAPENYNGRYFGEVTMREAMARSLNSVAVRAAQRVGPEKIVEVARRLGISSDLRPDLSLALGTSEVTPLELTGAYAVVANGGNLVRPHGVLEIRDREGTVLYSREPNGGERVLDRDILGQVDDLLKAVIVWGTGQAAQLSREAGGKTGTTQDYRDAWFVGYSGALVTGIWVGNDDGTPMKEVTGGKLPARLWREFMQEALAGDRKTADAGN